MKLIRNCVGILFILNVLSFPMPNKAKTLEYLDWYDKLIETGENIYNGKVIRWDKYPEFYKRLKISSIHMKRAGINKLTSRQGWSILQILAFGIAFLGLLRRWIWIRQYCIVMFVSLALISPLFNFWVYGNTIISWTYGAFCIGYLLIALWIARYLSKPEIRAQFEPA